MKNRSLAAGLLLLLGTSLLPGCATIYQQSDTENPCASNNVVECERWKANFPKEYARYLDRMKKGSDPGSGTNVANAPQVPKSM